MSVCLIIHGTWGDRSDFAFEDSLFCRALAARVEHPMKFLRFEWSGKNSTLERKLSSERLIEFLSSIPHEDDPIFCIAHSHGGNVAVDALCNTAAVSRVKGVVTLGTPFLSTEVRRWVLTLETFSGGMFVLGLITALEVACAMSIVSVFFDNINPIFGGIGAIIILLLYIGGGYGWRHADSISTKISTELVRVARELKSGMEPRTLDVPMLIVSTKADEAMWWLRQVFSVEDLPMKLTSILITLIGYCVALMLPLLAIVNFSGARDFRDELMKFSVWALLSLFLFALISFTFAKLVLLTIGSGRSLNFWDPLLTRIVTTRVPLALCSSVKTIDAPLRDIFGGLWHSKYMRSGRIVDEIATTINSWYK